MMNVFSCLKLMTISDDDCGRYVEECGLKWIEWKLSLHIGNYSEAKYGFVVFGGEVKAVRFLEKEKKKSRG